MVTREITKGNGFSRAFLESLYEQTDGERFRNCIQCGTCSGICPMGSWMEYAPRKMVAAMKSNVFEEVIQSDSVWMCVSCFACTAVCPQELPLTRAMMARAKEELILAGNVPSELQLALEYTQRYGNVLGESPRKRADWGREMDPPIPVLGKTKTAADLLWFVGDYGSYHPRANQAVKAFARVLNALEVDFAILGAEEVSDGDSQRMAGEIGLFDMLAMKNNQAMRKYQFNEIITTDPHAFNALKNEPDHFGISVPVKHYTQFLAERLDQLQSLMVNEIEFLVSYHDPCYLGRANGVYDEPRHILEAIPGVVLVEMAHNRSTSLCCGGGGGGMWLDGFLWEKSQTRLSEWRVREALDAWPEFELTTVLQRKRKTNPSTRKVEMSTQRVLAVACPYEAPRFEDAIKMLQKTADLKVKDIAELLADAMGLER